MQQNYERTQTLLPCCYCAQGCIKAKKNLILNTMLDLGKGLLGKQKEDRKYMTMLCKTERL
jgi:hypothetical protein